MPTKPLALTLSLPESLEISEEEARELLVLKLIDEGRLSQSQGAKVLRISRRELLDLMARHQVPVVRYTEGEWEREAKVLGSAASRRRRIAR